MPAATSKALRFSLDIDPMPAPRARARAIVPKGGKRPIASIYNPKEYTDWVSKAVGLIYDEIRETDPFTGPVTVGLVVRVARPKTTKLSAPKPDVDNYAKAVLDAMTKAGVWGDDTQVEFLAVKKEWADYGEIRVEVQEGTPI